jgi:protein SCO1
MATMRSHLLTASTMAALATVNPVANAQINVTPQELERIGVDEHLGARVPFDATFVDHEGRPVRLGSYFSGRRPVVLNLVYHRCTMLCSMVLNGVIRSLKQTAWSVGEEYEVVTLSIDPRDTAQVAAGKRARVLAAYDRPSAQRGWHFLVGPEAESRRVADAVGFRYRFDRATNQYAHAAVTMLLTPDGRVARYLYGIDYPQTDVRVGLLEASEGRQVSTVERIILFCYHYDPQGHRYALVAQNVMKVGGVATMFGLGGFLSVMWLRERRRKRDDGPGINAQRPLETN